ncbi:hypothetical protein BJX62DRAFT_172338 [Aspergillus germanicus]
MQGIERVSLRLFAARSARNSLKNRCRLTTTRRCSSVSGRIPTQKQRLRTILKLFRPPQVYNCPVTARLEVQLSETLLSPSLMVVDAKAEGFVIASSAMPFITANATATMNIRVHTTHVVSGEAYADGAGVYNLLVTGATSTTPTPTTDSHTVTVTPTPTSTSTSSDDSEPTETEPYYPPLDGQLFGDKEEDSVEESGGLSSDAKAGIGAGVAVGTVLLVVGAILLHRRHKTRNPPKTIRETTSGPSQAEL